MKQTNGGEGTGLRLWPGVAAVVAIAGFRLGLPLVDPGLRIYGVLGAVAIGLAVLIWWALFSRASRAERWGGLGLFLLAMAGTYPLLHPSISKGMMGLMYPLYCLPVLGTALVAGVAAGWKVVGWRRWATMAAAAGLACGGFLLLRTEGMTGEGVSEFAWRWSETKEERVLSAAELPAVKEVVADKEPAHEPAAAVGPEPASAPKPESAAPAQKEAEWPGFRGPGRDSALAGVQIETDWAAAKPVELWRRPVGPGWSSFAVDGERIFTQEQRGEDEVVSCYNAATGEPVWAQREPVRFWESNAGAGPRATPALAAGRVYAFGATGILTALDARTGRRIWRSDVATDAKEKVPEWGFSGSPLVVGDLVVVAASGRAAAYDTGSGKLRWLGPDMGGSYSSPHLFEAGGEKQILLTGSRGAVSLSLADGTALWKHSWEAGVPIVQPAVAGEGELLLSGGDGNGMRRVKVTRGAEGWKVEERWTTMGLKPYFNDFVVHGGHVYGFDRSILACIGAGDGVRKWKGGRYGYGQMVLLKEQGLLLVVSEEGDVALVKAAPDQFVELARVPAVEGKTWNHPVLAGERLFVRNGSEMVAFRLARKTD